MILEVFIIVEKNKETTNLNHVVNGVIIIGSALIGKTILKGIGGIDIPVYFNIVAMSGGALIIAISVKDLLPTKSKKFEKFFRSVGFCNKLEEMPRLLNYQRTVYGHDYIFSLPYGLNIEHFEKVQLSLEQCLDSKIIFEYKEHKIIAKSFETKLEKKYPYQFIKTEHPCEIVIGYTAEGILTIRLDKHMMITGSTGWGKSVMENTIITNLILNNNPETMALYLCDFSFKELSIYEDCEIVEKLIIEKPKLMELMEHLEKTCHDRLMRLKNAKVRDIDNYNKKATEMNAGIMKYIIVFIDEFAQINEKKDSKLFDIITRLTALSRATGIYFVVCTQRPSVDVLPGTIRANIDIRACFHTADSTNSEIVLDEEGAEKLNFRGRGLLRYNGQPLEEFHAMMLEEDQILKLIEPKLKEVFMITERDKKIIEQLKIKEATAEELHELFFKDSSPQWRNKRLKTLVDNNVIKRKKVFETSQYVYYV